MDFCACLCSLLRAVNVTGHVPLIFSMKKLKVLVLKCLDNNAESRCTIEDVGALIDDEDYVQSLLRFDIDSKF